PIFPSGCAVASSLPRWRGGWQGGRFAGLAYWVCPPGPPCATMPEAAHKGPSVPLGAPAEGGEAVIPQRVRLKGFLCYKDEQTVEFDGNATLWMLSGLNGSGKSAVFDAVTFALFGHHRGGGQHNHELFNKESDTLTVEFDFLLDGKLYRAKRTLKRDTKGGAR